MVPLQSAALCKELARHVKLEAPFARLRILSREAQRLLDLAFARRETSQGSDTALSLYSTMLTRLSWQSSTGSAIRVGFLSHLQQEPRSAHASPLEVWTRPDRAFSCSAVS